jgi:hypothetical protein
MIEANGISKRVEKMNGAVNGGVGHIAEGKMGNSKTDPLRWRLENIRGCHIWKYLESDEECERWPQSVSDRYFLGLDTVSLSFHIASIVYIQLLQFFILDLKTRMNC